MNDPKYPQIVAPRFPGEKERYRVTVAQWDKRPDALGDAFAYLYVPENEEWGLDCWRMVEGVDKWPKEAKYDVVLVSGNTLAGKPADFPLYVSRNMFEQMGLS